jgi:tight adherence protein B
VCSRQTFVLTAAVALVGLVASVRLGRAARRAAAGDHVRKIAAQSRWRLPPRPRAWLAHALADAAVAADPETVCEVWIGGTVVVGLLALGFSSAMVIPALVAGLAAGPIALRVARGRAQHRFVGALAPGLEHVAAALRGGASVSEALATLVDDRGPLAPDLRRVCSRASLGLGLADSLAVWPTERPVPAVRAAAGALALAVSVGGRAADALDGLAVSLRERLGAVAEARALSSQARLSAIVVGAAPIAYLAFSALVDPSSVAVLVGTATGQVCLALGIGLDAFAIVWMRHVVRDDAA